MHLESLSLNYNNYSTMNNEYYSLASAYTDIVTNDYRGPVEYLQSIKAPMQCTASIQVPCE